MKAKGGCWILEPRNDIPRWLSELEPEDWHFILRFILASGSLKEVAAEYGISYPTVRLRLNRLIEKIRILHQSNAKSPFHQKVRILVSEGKLDLATARTLIKLFDEGREGSE